MPRPVPQQSEPVNGDSFLDIVASVVSIMIIMVVMEGMRIKNTPVKVAIPSASAAVDLEKDLAEEQSLRADIWKLAEDVRAVQRQAAARGLERDMLATVATAAEQEVAERRQGLSRVKQADFDVARALSDTQSELHRLALERERAEGEAGPPVVIESYPTPISRAVDGPESHLLITNGRVVFVPFEALVEQMKAQAQRQAYKLARQPELTDTVGPVDGFRLRYTLEVHEVSADEARRTGRGGTFVQLQKFSIVPSSSDLGEPVRLALAEGSDFRRALSKILPGRVTVTIWVYPDGFEAFRQIRKELYRLGYSIAARPLPPGQPIGGSPEGSKSAAQ